MKYFSLILIPSMLLCWQWEITVLDSIGDVGQYCDFASDAIGTIYISYYDATNGDLKFYYGSGNNGNIIRVDTTGDVGKFTSIETFFSFPDQVWISYYDETNKELKVAYSVAPFDSWEITIVDSIDDVGKFTSISLDTLHYPWISYYDESNEDLKCARFDGGLWKIFRVDTEGNVGLYTAIIIAAGKVYILYYDSTNGDLKKAFLPSFQDTEWIITKVDTAGNVGEWINCQNSCFCSYYDVTNKNPKAINTLDNTVWVIDTTDKDIGKYSSMYASWVVAYNVTDGDLVDKPHFSDPFNSIDTFGDVGLYCKNFIAPDAFMWVVYYDATNGDLKFAEYNLSVGEKNNYDNFSFHFGSLFNKVTFSYRLLKQEFVSFEIYDISGKLIFTLIEKEQSPGEYFIEWNMDNMKLPSGVYFLIAKIGNIKKIKKIILIK